MSSSTPWLSAAALVVLVGVALVASHDPSGPAVSTHSTPPGSEAFAPPLSPLVDGQPYLDVVVAGPSSRTSGNVTRLSPPPTDSLGPSGPLRPLSLRREHVRVAVAREAPAPAPRPAPVVVVDREATQQLADALAARLAEERSQPSLAWVQVHLNTVLKGERLVTLTPEGETLMKREDLTGLGVALDRHPGVAREIEGVAWVPLSALGGELRHSLSLESLSLDLTADPALLGQVALGGSSRRLAVPTMASGSAFVNYAVLSQCLAEGWDCDTMARSEVGVNAMGLLFFSDAVFTNPTPGLVRGVSHVTHDFPEHRVRLQVGDTYSRTGVFGSGAMVGGVGLFTDYAATPGFSRYALPAIDGVAQTPSQVDVYVNGNRVARHEVPAGRFQITDLAPTLGAGEVQVRTRDAFGREQLIERSYYQSASLLAPGVQEFGGWVGALRKDPGLESWSYGSPALLATYRRGLTHSVAAGTSFEVSPAVSVGALEGSLRLLDVGVLSGSGAVSTGERGPGGAWTAGAVTSLGAWSMGADVMWLSPSWENLASSQRASGQRQWIARASTSVGLGEVGSVGLQAATSRYYDQPGDVGLALLYGKGLGQGVNLSMRASASQETEGSALHDLWRERPDRQVEGSLMLSWSPGDRVSMSTSLRTDEQGSATVVRAQRDPGTGEGFGVSGELAAATPQQGVDGAVEPSGDLAGTWRGPFSVATASTHRSRYGQQAWSGSVAGGLVWLNGAPHATRPVQDAFGLVKVGKVEGLPVYRANREVGRTNADGELLVPDMLSYQSNSLSLDLAELPLDHQVAERRIEAVPGLRGGVVVDFHVRRITAVTGRLVAGEGDGRQALKLGLLEVKGPDGPVTSPVGYDGAFYFEDLPEGPYTGSMWVKGQGWLCPITVGASETILNDLGEVRCELRP